VSLHSWLRENLAENVRTQTSHVILLEEKNDEVDMTVKIVRVPDTVTTIRLDKVGHLSALTGKGWQQICDYLLVAQSDDRYHAIFVELKQTLRADTKHREQLRRSLPLLHYFLSAFHVDGGFMLSASEFLVSYFLIGKQWSPRWDKPQRRANSASIFEAEEYRSITIRTSVAPRISFNELVKR